MASPIHVLGRTALLTAILTSPTIRADEPSSEAARIRGWQGDLDLLV